MIRVDESVAGIGGCDGRLVESRLHAPPLSKGGAIAGFGASRCSRGEFRGSRRARARAHPSLGQWRCLRCPVRGHATEHVQLEALSRQQGLRHKVIPMRRLRLSVLVPMAFLSCAAPSPVHAPAQGSTAASPKPAALPPPPPTPVPDPARDLASKIDAIFSAQSKPGVPGCAVGVYRAGEILFARGYGLANLEHDIPIKTDSVFDIASISKQFTAMAILLLEREGKVSLDDDIRKYVPELPTTGARSGSTTCFTTRAACATTGDSSTWPDSRTSS
jgi:hypothetical protein